MKRNMFKVRGIKTSLFFLFFLAGAILFSQAVLAATFGYNYLSKKTTDNNTDYWGSWYKTTADNFFDNSCSGANFVSGTYPNGTLKCSMPTVGDSNNTYNATYATWLPNYTLYRQWWYNQTVASSGTYNATYAAWAYNQTATKYFYNMTVFSEYNYNQTYSGSTYNVTYNGLINNASYLSTYNSTYDTWLPNYTLYRQWWYNQTVFGEYNYNQTTPAVSIANKTIWDNYNDGWLSTYNATYATWAYNQTTASSGTYNGTYDSWAYNMTDTECFYNMTVLSVNSDSYWNLSGSNLSPIDATYKVAIGSDTPEDWLTIATSFANINLGEGDGNANYFWLNGNSLTEYVLKDDGDISLNTHPESDMYFRVNGDPVMIISSQGRVSIGSEELAGVQTLEVTGTGNFTDELYVKGFPVSEWLYNQTLVGTSYNATYAAWAYNQTATKYFYNMTVFGDYNYNQTYIGSGNIFNQYLNTTNDVAFEGLNLSYLYMVNNSKNFLNQSIYLKPKFNTSSSTSAGGAILLDNTNNIGAGLIIYTNQGATAIGRLVNIRSDNSAFDQSALNINYAGTADVLTVVSNSNASSQSAMDISSSNENYTSVGISGYEKGHGTVKITHFKPSVDDANAAAISINLAGNASSPGTAAQGIYIYSEGNTTGNLISLNNNGVSPFYITSIGNLVSTVNITASKFIGDGSSLTGIGIYNVTYNGLINNASYLSTYNSSYYLNTGGTVSGNVNVTGNITQGGMTLYNNGTNDIIKGSGGSYIYFY